MYLTQCIPGGGVAALPFLLAVARRTRAILLQNMCLALGSIAALALPVLAGGHTTLQAEPSCCRAVISEQFACSLCGLAGLHHRAL